MGEIYYSSIKAGQAAVLRQLKAARASNPGYRVVDIGGAAGGWTSGVCDLVVDINAPDGLRNLQADICTPDGWRRLEEYTSTNGKFDYAICTHTLEDIYNPVAALAGLPRIAGAGVITMPSIRTELSRVESPGWLGYIHHRWLFGVEDGGLVLAPKLGFLECLHGLPAEFQSGMEQIEYHWEGSVDYRMFMDNYLGPNATAVISAYTEFVQRQLSGG